MNLIDVLFSRAVIVPGINSEIQVLNATTPASASVDANGLVAFQNGEGTQLFTLQLPLYTGGVA